MTFRGSRKHHSSTTSSPPSTKSRSIGLPSSPTLRFLVYTSLSVCVFCKTAATVVKHARTRCVRTAQGHRDRFCNRHVHNVVGILRSFLLLAMFYLTALARKTTAYSTAQRTESRFRSPNPCPSLLLLLARQLCFRVPTRGRRKFLHLPSFRSCPCPDYVNRTPTQTACTDGHSVSQHILNSMITFHHANARAFRFHIFVSLKTIVIHVSCLVLCRTRH